MLFLLWCAGKWKNAFLAYHNIYWTLGSLNSAINFFIYVTLSSRFRYNCLYLLPRCLQRFLKRRCSRLTSFDMTNDLERSATYRLSTVDRKLSSSPDPATVACHVRRVSFKDNIADTNVDRLGSSATAARYGRLTSTCLDSAMITLTESDNENETDVQSVQRSEKSASSPSTINPTVVRVAPWKIQTASDQAVVNNSPAVATPEDASMRSAREAQGHVEGGGGGVRGAEGGRRGSGSTLYPQCQRKRSLADMLFFSSMDTALSESEDCHMNTEERKARERRDTITIIDAVIGTKNQAPSVQSDKD
jgi:hypothetical protein